MDVVQKAPTGTRSCSACDRPLRLELASSSTNAPKTPVEAAMLANVRAVPAAVAATTLPLKSCNSMLIPADSSERGPITSIVQKLSQLADALELNFFGYLAATGLCISGLMVAVAASEASRHLAPQLVIAHAACNRHLGAELAQPASWTADNRPALDPLPSPVALSAEGGAPTSSRKFA